MRSGILAAAVGAEQLGADGPQKRHSGGGTGRRHGAEPTVYFDEMIGQEFILAFDEEENTAGFMTFKKDYTCDALRDFGTSLYITTICVKKELRKQHIMSGLYDCMEKTAAKACGCPRISTRTWSENEAHMKGLQHRGYRLLAVLKDDRGPGIDTVYYGMEL